MAITNSKRVIAGSFLFLVWIALLAIHDLPLSASSLASLVPLRCPLFWILDITCPTCGLGRSLVAAALGHPAESFRWHPFGLPIFWGSQALLVGSLLAPRSWEYAQRVGRGIYQRRPLFWGGILLYCIWGFCWRAPI